MTDPNFIPCENGARAEECGTYLEEVFNLVKEVSL